MKNYNNILELIIFILISIISLAVIPVISGCSIYSIVEESYVSNEEGLELPEVKIDEKEISEIGKEDIDVKKSYDIEGEVDLIDETIKDPFKPFYIEENGETIYETRGGPVPPRSWGVTTYKDNKVFVHVLNAEDNDLLLPDFGKKVKGITLFKGGAKLKYKQDAFGITISIPEDVIDETDTILVIEI